MKFSDIELPSNKKFGLFFASIFTIVSAYCFIESIHTTAWIFFGLACIFALIGLLKPKILQPLNKLWMRFGLLLGMIVSPIVLGVIFFVMFTPIGLLMRFFGRDELRLKVRGAPSFWKVREPSGPASDSFKNQF